MKMKKQKDWANKILNRRLQIILDEVCIAFGVTAGQMRDNGRTRKIATARSLYFHLARSLTLIPWPQISDFINKDHSTAICSVRRSCRHLEKFREYRMVYNRLKAELEIRLDERPANGT